MKRDMDLIREILLVAESDGTYKSAEHYTEEQVAYHVQLLIDAGLIEGRVLFENRDGRQIPVKYVIIRLTMAGHDFIDASRENKVWEKAKSTIKEKGVGWTVDIVKAVCIQIVKSHIGVA
jgi:Hypothetical protein (DUF2513)